MKTRYTDMDIHFYIDDISIYALNIIFERFTRIIPCHSHGNGCYEIHYIPEGYGKLEASDREYELSPNTLFVTGPHMEHAQSPCFHNPMQEYCVYFSLSRPARVKKTSQLMNTFLKTVFWIGQDTQGIHLLMKQLFDELENRYTGYQNQVEFLLSQLIIYMVRNYEQEKRTGNGIARSNLGNSKSIIIEEYFLYEYRFSSLEALSGKLMLSPRQTQRLLQEYYGKTFQQKKTEARMSAAAVLLAEKGRSISSAAEELGYSSAGHFSSAFKKYYGMSPAEYRQKIRP